MAPGPSPGGWQLDLKVHFIFPGLINPHDHLHLNNIPPLTGEVKFANSYAWIAAWHDLVDFEIVPVLTSDAARVAIEPQL